MVYDQQKEAVSTSGPSPDPFLPAAQRKETHMALCEMHLGASNALGKMTSFMAIVPEGRSGPFPVLYLLHGLSDDHTAWARRTSLERYVQNLPLMVVMPNGERSFYTNSVSNAQAAFETFLTRDLIGFVDSAFHTVAAREGRAVAGLSMGGYGAMKLCLKHPDLFCAGVSHSGAVAFGSQAINPDWSSRDEWVGIFGENPAGGENDAFALAERIDTLSRPALRVDCGIDDFLIEDNRRFHAHLGSLDYLHEYEEPPGGHDWDYWDTHVQQTIAFVARAMGIE